MNTQACSPQTSLQPLLSPGNPPSPQNSRIKLLPLIIFVTLTNISSITFGSRSDPCLAAAFSAFWVTMALLFYLGGSPEPTTPEKKERLIIILLVLDVISTALLSTVIALVISVVYAAIYCALGFTSILLIGYFSVTEEDSEEDDLGEKRRSLPS